MSRKKELGDKLWDRLKSIARLRRGLDDANIDSPIHVWGGLDPIITPLLFFAGASIFDGVSWLRYAYKDGVAICRESAIILNEGIGVTASRPFANHLTALQNLRFLEHLAVALQEWVDFEGESFEMFDHAIAGKLERAYKTMKTRIPELKEA